MRLVALAVVLVAVVFAVHVPSGAGDFVPARPADPCAARERPPVAAALEPLAERIVLDGLDATACDVGLSRERLVLDLAEGEQVDPEALRAGLRSAAERIDPLPPVSDLLPEALELSGLPGIVQDAAGAIPDSVVDDLLPTRELLTRAVEELDIAAILSGLEDPDALEPLLQDAILEAAKDQLLDSLDDLLPF